MALYGKERKVGSREKGLVVVGLSETVRFTVSVSSGLDRFDEAIREKKYEDRSRAIRNLIPGFLIEREWEKKESGRWGP